MEAVLLVGQCQRVSQGSGDRGQGLMGAEAEAFAWGKGGWWV